MRTLLALLAFSIMDVAMAQEPLPIEPQPGVLLLINGQTLHGKITRAGDRYYVALDDGAINLPSNQVLMQCRDLNEAYARQRAARTTSGVQSHVKLAEWCLENKLFTEALGELDEAALIEPKLPKIAVLRRRVELASRPANNKVAGATATKTVVATEELDRMARSMPAGALEGYASTIQPLLLNHCATAACHGAQSKTDLRILRAAGGGAPTRRLTQRNLYHVLNFLDRDNPDASKLLKAACEPHAASRAPIFKSRETEQYRLLAEWVHIVLQTPTEPALLAVDPHELIRQLPPDAKLSTSSTVQPASAQISAAPRTPQEAALAAKWSKVDGDAEFRVAEDGTILTSLPADQIIDEKQQRAARSNKPPIRGAAGMANRPNVRRGAVPQVTPQDPFDPELFNRK